MVDLSTMVYLSLTSFSMSSVRVLQDFQKSASVHFSYFWKWLHKMPIRAYTIIQLNILFLMDLLILCCFSPINTMLE